MKIRPVFFESGKLKIIDQRRLPARLVVLECKRLKQVYDYIKTLAVRGAPAIGVFAAYGFYISVRDIKDRDKQRFFRKLHEISNYIESSRPTAVNLSWALKQMLKSAEDNRDKDLEYIKSVLLKQAKQIHKEDELMCKNIGIYGQRLVSDGDTILTHCNAGSLATGGEGTALSIVYYAKKNGKKIKVFADETRPLLQGARLTVWELINNGIDTTLICDNMAAFLMQQGRIDKIIVGADRIAANGDTANKIGTYNLAVLAKAHMVPFYVAAPSSTFDFSILNGEAIPIEFRNEDEVRMFAGKRTAPKNIKTYNPAFDVTPAHLINAIITEKGVFAKPYNKSLDKLRPLKNPKKIAILRPQVEES